MPHRGDHVIGKILRLLREIRIHPAYLLIPITLSLCTAAFEGIGMGLLIPILNGFLQKSFAFLLSAPYIGPLAQKLPASFLNNDRLLFGLLLAGFIVVFILKNIFRFLCVVSVGFFAERSLHHLRKALFGKYLSFGKLFFDRTNVGHHTMLLTDFSFQALRPLQTIDSFINALFSLIVYLVVLLMISWKLTLIALPLFVLLHYAIRTMILTIRHHSLELTQRGSEMGKKSVEILSTIPLVKSYRTEHQEQRQYAHISNEKASLDFRVRSLQALILPLQEVITLLVASSIFIGAIVWFGREQIASAPALVVYFYIVLNASSKFGTLSGFRGTLAVASGPLNEVLSIFAEQGKFFVRGGSSTFPGLKSTIEFCNLSFGYMDEREVLKNISFRIQRGQMVAIVGPTGAGKSSLISLLMRYYDCPPGSIFIDGTDVRSFTLDSYIKHIALVSQDTLLIHDTLRNNIAYGLTDVSDAVVREAVDRARLSELVASMPQGLDTLIGDRGVKLSGGEKQRVSIARALLKQSEILILDEATSSLDSRTEKLIQDAIDEAVHERTAIVIAHRLSTIQHANRIVVMDEGRVVEEGTLQELLDRKGLFFTLWEEQKF
ncbi:MAG: ABC transporter ATP-binding protein [Candidatus Peribacteraceae bacterium]|nr:ABC transporter ATP-binding protein [Candidatus Peribacteraceae bacterium]MDD5075204.1 ABC transporter ATP-binding protein [Candidatus Peribacteraceae bacterium]